jgi:DNA repair protein SbcC/Rad50
VEEVIEYDYLLIRDERDEIKKFVPGNFPKSFHNLSLIEGDNSKGKSTLLNIIALGLYGQKDKTIHPELKAKINSLMDVTRNQLTFKFSITNKDNSLSLICEKKDLKKADIHVYERIGDKKPSIITYDRFIDKYKLIYDIPVNPTKRIVQLKDDIKDKQNRIGNKLSLLTDYIREEISNIRNSKNPNTIQEMKDKLDQYNYEKEQCKGSNDVLLNELDIAEKYTYFRFFKQYSEEYEERKKELESLKKSKNTKTSEIKKMNKKYKQLIEQLNTRLIHLHHLFNTIYKNLSTIVPDEKQHLKIWNGINLQDIFSEFKVDILIITEINELIRVLNSKISLDDGEKSYKIAEMYDQLVDFLEGFTDCNVTFPGNINIDKFIEELKTKKKEYEPKLVKSKNIQDTISSLQSLKEQLTRLDKDILDDLRDLKKSQPGISEVDNEYDIHNRQISQLQNVVNDLQRKHDFYYTNWLRKGRETFDTMRDIKKQWVDFTDYTEENLIDKIENLKQDIDENKRLIQNYDLRIKDKNDQISQLEEKNEHKLQPHLDIIEELILPNVRTLQQKFQVNFTKYISNIENLNPDLELPEDQKKYYEVMFVYLAKIINHVRHIDVDYKVEKIDIINECIITENGKEINFIDFGTGQGQSTYLQAKLTSRDNRKIIAMFDEVAMMGEKALEPIYSKFNELYNSNDLLAGIVVQRGKNERIISLER